MREVASTLPTRAIAAKAVSSPPSSTEQAAAANQTKSLLGWLKSAEAIAAVGVALLAIALHFQFILHVGGLWRDEANSVQLATLPTWSELWLFLDYDSFPILFFALLRTWSGLFGASNDIALRALGCITGLAIIGSLLLNARAFGIRWPLLSLALIGLNPMIIRYGDSTRAYGLGILLILLTFRSFWRLVDKPSPPNRARVVAATILAVLSVQCLYYNSALLLAIAAGALTVALRQRAWRTAGIILGIGILAAGSLLVYLPMVLRMREWTFMVSYPGTFSWLWKRAGEVIGSPDPLGIWVWTGVFIIGLGSTAAFALQMLPQWFAQSERPAANPSWISATALASALPAQVVFAAVALSVGVAAYALFLRVLNYYTQPWYYITLVVFAACALEVITGARSPRQEPRTCAFFRAVRLASTFVLLVLAPLPGWTELRTRHTNVDLLAAQLRTLTKKDDIVLVLRWECAISLNRYYAGPAQIITVPPIPDHRFHRYDLVKRAMMSQAPCAPVLHAIQQTLRNDRTVWLVGALQFLPPGQMPVIPAPASDDPEGWNGAPYYKSWSEQTAFALERHAAHFKPVQVPVGQPVNSFEDLPLTAFSGCREDPVSAAK